MWPPWTAASFAESSQNPEVPVRDLFVRVVRSIISRPPIALFSTRFWSSGDLSSAQLEVQTPTLRSQIRNIAAHYSLENGDATLKDLRASLLGGELTSTGKMSNIDGNAHSKFNAELRGIQLAEMNRALKSSAMPKGVSLGGVLNAEANAAWGKTFDDVVAHADAAVQGKVSGNAQVDPAGERNPRHLYRRQPGARPQAELSANAAKHA